MKNRIIVIRFIIYLDLLCVIYEHISYHIIFIYQQTETHMMLIPLELYIPIYQLFRSDNDRNYALPL